MARKKAAEALLTEQQIAELPDDGVLDALLEEIKLDSKRYAAYIQRINKIQDSVAYAAAAALLDQRTQERKVRGTPTHF